MQCVCKKMRVRIRRIGEQKTHEEGICSTSQSDFVLEISINDGLDMDDVTTDLLQFIQYPN